MVEKYYYSVYGLKIEVDFKLNQLVKIDKCEEADVIIKHGIMSDDIHNNIKNGIRNYLTKKECWFIAKDIGIYRILNGREIFIEEINGSFDEVSAFLLGSALGCILIQRDIAAIHGSTVVINNEGIIITGRMGAGKSTLTSALISRGYKFLADDISAITDGENGTKTANAAYPLQKLCRDTAIKFGHDVNKLVKTDKDRDKFFIPSLDNFTNQKCNVKYIFEVALKDEDDESTEVEIEEIQGLEKLNAVIRNIYRSEVALKIGINAQYFKNIVSLAEKITYYRIKRPRNLFTVDCQIKEIMNKIIR